MFDKFCDKIYIINVPKYQVRLKAMLAQMNLYQISHYTVIRAIDGEKDILDSILKISKKKANSLSHRQAIIQAKREKFQSILIIEDDCCFHPFLNLYLPMIQYFIQSHTCNVLLFHSNNSSQKILQIFQDQRQIIYGSHCYYINNQSFDYFIQYFESWKYKPLDYNFNSKHPNKRRSYCTDSVFWNAPLDVNIFRTNITLAYQRGLQK